MQYMHDNLWMHIVCEGEVQYPHYDLNPHYLWEAKMLKPFIKHKTFLVEFDDHIKPSKDIDFLKLGTKQ